MEPEEKEELQETHPDNTTQYDIDEQTAECLENNFTHHPPKGDQTIRYVAIRHAMKRMATLILTNTPPSREQSLALTKIEEACMWANAAIARNE